MLEAEASFLVIDSSNKDQLQTYLGMFLIIF
jgi:hypothetical protein